MPSLSATPSQQRGIVVTPRLPPFEFDETSVPTSWFDGDPGTTAAWNALSILAAQLEHNFIEAGRWLVDRVEDDALAEETRAFVRQEAYHAAVHDRLNRVLANRGLPVEEARRYLDDLFIAVKDLGQHRVWLVMALAAEQMVGELGHAVLADIHALDGASEKVRELFLWHFYEEVEHQAALHDGWVSVFGDGRPARDLRVLGAAYFAVFLTVAWPAVTVSLLPDRRDRARASTWAPLLRQMLGRDGMLWGAFGNLRRVADVGFHPFQNHDPVPALDRFRDQLIAAAWARPVAPGQPHGEHARDTPSAKVEAADAVRYARFLRYAIARTATFERDLRRA